MRYLLNRVDNGGFFISTYQNIVSRYKTGNDMNEGAPKVLMTPLKFPTVNKACQSERRRRIFRQILELSVSKSHPTYVVFPNIKSSIILNDNFWQVITVSKLFELFRHS